MIIKSFGLLGVLMVSPGTYATDNASRCYAIPDHDRRYACLAEAKGQQQGCNAIRNTDARAMCSSKTSGQKTRCYIIKDYSRRQACLAGMDY